MQHTSGIPRGEGIAACDRLAAYLRGERDDLEPGDLDRVFAELERLRATEVAARALSDALSRDEGYDHFCNEETERAAVALGRLLP